MEALTNGILGGVGFVLCLIATGAIVAALKYVGFL